MLRQKKIAVETNSRKDEKASRVVGNWSGKVRKEGVEGRVRKEGKEERREHWGGRKIRKGKRGKKHSKQRCRDLQEFRIKQRPVLSGMPVPAAGPHGSSAQEGFCICAPGV